MLESDCDMSAASCTASITIWPTGLNQEHNWSRIKSTDFCQI